MCSRHAATYAISFAKASEIKKAMAAIIARLTTINVINQQILDN